MTAGAGKRTDVSPEVRPDRRRLAQFSVRTRITVSLALMTLIALTTAGVLVYALESARIQQRISESIEQEIAEFATFQENGVDPESGESFDDVRRLLREFLLRNVTDDDEFLAVAVEGRSGFSVTPNRYGEVFPKEAAFQQAFAELRAAGGGTRVLDLEPYGETWVTVQRVSNNRAVGHLVLVNFLDDEHSELNRTMRTYAIVAALSLGLIVVLAAFQAGRLLAPLRTLREAASDITATDLSRRIPEQGNDDITALTRTINGMLIRLEQGFENQRRFLDDAGHELKTPLTVLRGHLELLDAGDPEDIAETRELLLDETDRMSRLVGDLILLAKTRRPDFLALRHVGLDRLTHTLLAKARALGDRDWQLDGTADVLVRMDEQRITQAVLQLADNAVKHTDPDAVVALGSSYDGRVARIWVRDTGDGVRDEDKEQIFRRFGRSHTRDGDEGFGLGLSIVTAVVEAHGGSVAVHDAAPRGARFEITLPAEEDTWPAS